MAGKAMNKQELRKKFIVSQDVIKARLEELVNKAIEHCVVTEQGEVHLESKSLGAKNQIKLVLAARYLAAQLDNSFSAEVTVAELASSTGLPENQIRARANEAIKERFASSPVVGTYIASPHKIETFLGTLKTAKK